MSRLMFVALGLALVPASASFAQVKQAIEKGNSKSKVMPAALYGEAKPSSCPGCGQAPVPPFVPDARHTGQNGSPGLYGDYLRYQLAWDQHECAPYGCPKPLGCSNFWSECKFIFGSCRQFFGTGDSTIYHFRNTRYRNTPQE